MGEERELMDNLVQELRRGTVVLSVLSQLGTKKYGYALVQALERKGIGVDPNTLYPLLRRLEKQGILSSEWEMGESKPRKYYCRTEEGNRIYMELKVQWKQMAGSLEQMLEEEE